MTLIIFYLRLRLSLHKKDWMPNWTLLVTLLLMTTSRRGLRFQLVILLASSSANPSRGLTYQGIYTWRSFLHQCRYQIPLVLGKRNRKGAAPFGLSWWLGHWNPTETKTSRSRCVFIIIIIIMLYNINTLFRNKILIVLSPPSSWSFVMPLLTE
jgi:hypothetical protein